ncbi:MAG: hypothetical protein SYC29_08130 [Planctomycetota bacterium]|nr:hypothetical protein [Planctomycetota bacterium]
MKLAFAFVAALAVAPFASAELIFDNGGPDGTNGLSNFQGDLSGTPYDRMVADDFVLGGSYAIQQAVLSGVWYAGGGLGQTDSFRVAFIPDVGGAPDADMGNWIYDDVVALADEELTGSSYFSRPEVKYTVDLPDVNLGAGTYWVSLQPQGTVDNFFHLTSAAGQGNLNGEQTYVSYPDLGAPMWTPGYDQFAEYYDVTFQLYGVPAPGALALLGLAGLVSRRRR